MRNLKRALSLALAAIMVLGLMVVGASAASTYDNFTDKDEIVNQEAVNTMVSLGVLAGKDDGSYYDPTGIVTRGEMAKIIAVCLNGGKDPVLGDSTNIPKFSDVPATHWAYNYIAYCVQQNIIAGRGDGTFAPDTAVTGSEAAKMFLCALGYRADLEGLVGNEWELNTNVLANQDADLYDGLESINPSQGLSRDNTAQMAYNAVQAQEVTYNNLFGDYTGVLQTFDKGTMLNNRFGVSKVEGVVVANNIMDIDGEGTTVAGKTRLTDIYVDGNHRVNNVGNVVRLIDDIYPVALDNSYLGQRVVLYVKGLKDLAPNAASTQVISEPILSADNTVATTTSRMKDADAVRSFLSDNGLSIPAAGVAFDADLTNGMVVYTENDTQIFNANKPGDALDRDFAVTNAALNARGTEYTFIDHDGDGTVDFIFRKLPRLAKVTVYNEADEELTIAGEGTIDFSDIANPEDVAKDDIVLYYKMNETYYLQVAEVVAGKVESYNNDNNSVKMDGVDYFVSTAGFEASSTDLEDYTPNTMDMVGNTYTFYLDASGNVIAWVLGEEAVGNYALILESMTSNPGNFASSKVKLLMADGTVGTYDVNLLASANKFIDFLEDANRFAPADGSYTASEKEQAMSNWLNGGGARNSVVTYAVGENGAVTLGDPADVSTVSTVVGQAAGTVTRSTANYNFNGALDNDGRAVNNLRVNDSTLFFIRNISEDDNTYSVVKGVSNLPTDTIWKDAAETDPATVEGAAFTNTGTNANVARAVVVDGIYRGTANYVYVSASYTGTLTVNGERVYTYPVVFEDGTAGTLNVTRDDAADGMVYQYTVNSNGVAELELTDRTINHVVSTYAKGSNLTIVSGDGSNTINTSYTIVNGAQMWNVDDTDNIYEETLTDNMSMAVVLDGSDFVKTVFVKETNVTEGDATVSNTAAPAGMTVRYAVGGVAQVFSGYNIQYGMLTPDRNVTYSYTVVMDNGEVKNYNNVNGTINQDGYLTISMPKNAATVTLNRVTGAAVVAAGPIDNTSTLAQVQAALNAADAGETVTVGGTGNYTLTGLLTVPAGVTFNVPGTLTLAGQTINGGGTVTCGTIVLGSQIGAGLTIKATNAVIAGDVAIDGTLEVENSITLSENAPAGTTYTITMADADSSITVGGNVEADIVTAGTVTITGNLTGDVTTETGAAVEISGTMAGTVYGEESITVGTDTVEPTEPAVISSVAVTATEPKLGDEALPTDVTTSTTGAAVTGTWTGATPVAAGTYTLTLKVTAGSGYKLADNVTVTVNGKAATATADGTYTYTVTVSGTTEPTAVITSVGVTGDKLGDYVFTINYEGKQPNLENAADKAAVIEKINEALAGKTDVKVDDLLNISGTYYAVYGTNKTVAGSISSEMAGTFKVFVNGQEVGTITTAEAEKGKTFSGLVLNTKPAGNLIQAGKGNVASGSTIKTTYTALNNQTSFTINAGTEVTADLYLVNAYSVTIGKESQTDTLTVKSYTVSGGEKVAVTASSAVTGNYFALGTSFELEGTKTTADKVTNLALTVNGHEVEAVPAGTAKRTYTYTLDASELAASETGGTAYTTFTLKEEATNVITLKIGDKTFETEGDISDTFTLKNTTTTNYPAAGEYIVVTKDTTGTVLTSDNTVTVAVKVSGATVTATVDALSSYTDTAYTETGVNYILVKAGEKQITIGENLEYFVNASGLTGAVAKGTGEATYFPAVGSITMLANENIKDNYQVVKTVGDNDAVLDKTGDKYVYTIANEEASFDVQVLQVADVRGEGPGMKDSGVNNLKYGEIYTAAGVTLNNNKISVDISKLVTFATNDKSDDAYGGISSDSLTALYHLTQTSSAGKRLYIGVAFAAPDSFKDAAKKVKVTVNGVAMTHDSSDEVFTLENDIVSGTGSDTLNGVYIQYLPFAKAVESGNTPSAANMKLDNADYEFVFTWLDNNGDVLGTSVCTVSRASN